MIILKKYLAYLIKYEIDLGSDIIRIKVQGFLKNITEGENLIFEEKAIKNKNKISFIKEEVKYNIKILDNEITMIREGKDFINTFIFNKNKAISNYTLKDNNYTIDMNINIIDIDIKDNLIYIKYKICDTDCLYEYKIEVSDYI